MLGLIPPSPALRTIFLAPHSRPGEIAMFTNALILEKSMYLVHAACSTQWISKASWCF